MNVKQQQDCARDSREREEPRCPGRAQSASGSFELNVSNCQKDDREDFVLEILEVVRQRKPWSLGTEWPNLRVTKDQKKQARGEEAHWPNIAHQSPAFPDIALRENENPSDDNKESSQAMIELTFLFVGQTLGRFRRVFRGRGRIHIHSRHAAHVVFLRPSRACKQKHQEECEQDGCRSAMNSREKGFSWDGQHLVLLLAGL